MNLEETLVREGRLTPGSRNGWPTVTVAGIDFESLHQAIFGRLAQIFLDHQPLRHQYDRTAAEINDAIEDGIDQMLNQAMNELWNRLRLIARTHSPSTRANIFIRKASSMYGFELPKFIASMFSGTGQLQIEDSLFGTRVVIYAPSYDTRDCFGRAALTVVNPSHEVHRCLCAVNIPLGNNFISSLMEVVVNGGRLLF